MFEVPEAKRVRRADLYSSTPTPSPPSSPTLASLLQSQLQEQFSFIPIESIPPVEPATKPQPIPTTENVHKEPGHEARTVTQDAAQDNDEEEDVGFAFRLFSNTAATPKVKIRSPSPAPPGSGGFVTPGRPDSYYFSQKAAGESKKQFDFAAVSGEDIIKGSTKSCPGAFLPWRVVTIHMKPSQGTKDTSDASNTVAASGSAVVDGDEEKTKRKTKPNKKRRIVIRQRLAKRKELKEQAVASQAEKEEAEREKRNRKNREKKIKRREKERAKKALTGSANPNEEESALPERSGSSSPENDGPADNTGLTE